MKNDNPTDSLQRVINNIEEQIGYCRTKRAQAKNSYEVWGKEMERHVQRRARYIKAKKILLKVKELEKDE